MSNKLLEVQELSKQIQYVVEGLVTAKALEVDGGIEILKINEEINKLIGEMLNE